MEQIDMMGSKTYTSEDLKSRAMTRLAAQGLGLAERLANVERAVYALRGEYAPSTEIEAQIAAIGQTLLAEEVAYEAENTQNALLIATLEYESAMGENVAASQDVINLANERAAQNARQAQ